MYILEHVWPWVIVAAVVVYILYTASIAEDDD
jgi:hypothetical protein